jgi:uncharacterized membrane protein YphA (DoxX/SURF4 family)
MSKGKKIVFWISTIIIAVAFFITGLGNLFPFAHIAQDMAHLGYPAYFLKILGTWKILGAVAIIVPGTPKIKEWAYAGVMLDLTGAALSRFFVGDDLQMIIVPLAIATLVTANYAVRNSMIADR